MAKHKRTCIVCGKEYEYCPSCPGNDPAWKMSYDSDNCREIYTVCAGYNMGHITIQEAAERIAKCDLSEKKNFSSSTRRIIGELLSYTPPKQTETTAVSTSYTNTKKEFRKKK